MYDRDDEGITPYPAPPTPETVKELKTVAFLLNGLYKQLADERDTITLASSQMTHAVKQFEGYVAQFEAFDKGIKKHTVETVHREAQGAADRVASAVGQRLADTLLGEMDHTVGKLYQASARVEQQFKQYEQDHRGLFKWFMVLFVVASVIGGLIGGGIVYHVMPLPTLTKEQSQQLDAGKALLKAWNHLDKKEQAKIIKLSESDAP